MGRAFAGSFAVAILARLAQLVMAILLARQLGPAGYGTFTFALGAAILGGQFASLGWPTLMARFIPQYTVDKDRPLLRGLVRVGDAVVFGATLGLSGIIYAVSLSPVLPHDLGAGLALAALLIVPMGFRLLRRQQLAAVKKAPIGLTIDELLAPVAVVLVSLFVGVGSAEQAFFVYVGASLLGALLGTLALRRYLPEGWRAAAATYKTAMWMGIALPMVVAVASRVVLNRIDVLMLAPLSTFDQVGLYGASFRITFLIGFVPQISSTVMWPLISEHHVTGKYAELKRVLVFYSMFILISSLVLSSFIFIFADAIIFYLFGDAFAPAAGILRILSVSQFFAALGNVSSSLLLMTGRHNIFGLVNLIGVLANIALNFWLIPLWAANGAATATLVTNLSLFLVLASIAWVGLKAPVKHNPAD